MARKKGCVWTGLSCICTPLHKLIDWTWRLPFQDKRVEGLHATCSSSLEWSLKLPIIGVIYDVFGSCESLFEAKIRKYGRAVKPIEDVDSSCSQKIRKWQLLSRYDLSGCDHCKKKWDEGGLHEPHRTINQRSIEAQRCTRHQTKAVFDAASPPLLCLTALAHESPPSPFPEIDFQLLTDVAYPDTQIEHDTDPASTMVAALSIADMIMSSDELTVVLGVVVSAAQLIDYNLKITGTMSEIYNRVKDAPERIVRYTIHIYQIIIACGVIQVCTDLNILLIEHQLQSISAEEQSSRDHPSRLH